MRKQMLKAFYVLMLILIQAPAWAELPYPQPFPGTINSGFGPRQDKSSFHRGLDFLKGPHTAISAIMDGYITDIRVSNKDGGNRLYVENLTDGIEIGYMHLFRDTNATEIASGQFILLKNHQFTFPAPSGLKSKDIVKTCVVIVNTTDKKAYIPNACWKAVKRLSPGGNVIVNYKSIAYAGTNTVKRGDKIAPVGNSGTKGDHLHIQYGKGDEAKHPMTVLEPIAGNGQLYARLDLTGTDTNNTNFSEALTTDPTVSKEVLTQNKFIDVRVDSTNTLDLDGFEFKINATNSAKPSLNGNIQYSFPNRSINFIPKTIDQFKQSISTPTCRRNLKPGEVVICPEVDWMGQKSGQRLVTRFRLGIDPDMFAQGKNTVNVTLKHVNQLPVSQEFPLNFTVETKPILERGVTLLSASCKKSDSGGGRVTINGTVFGPIKTGVSIFTGTLSSLSLSYFMSCENWGTDFTPIANFHKGCIRKSGQPSTTTWGIEIITSDLDALISNMRGVFRAEAYDNDFTNIPNVSSNTIPISCG